MDDKPSRHSIRLQGTNYTTGSYFVTICTHQKACLFGSLKTATVLLNPCGKVVETCWQEIPNHFPHVIIDTYIVMPNHIHGILVLQAEGAALGMVIQAFKTAVSRQIRKETLYVDGPVWQRNYYEHIIRNEDDFSRIRGYILENPHRWSI